MNVVIMGFPGSGKTTLARQLAPQLGLRHIEADQLFWQKNNDAKLSDFRQRVEAELLSDGWIFEGHLSKVDDLVLPRAQQIILIDYPDSLALWRLLRRECSNGWQGARRIIFTLQNYERLKQQRQQLLKGHAKVIRYRGGQHGLAGIVNKMRKNFYSAKISSKSKS
jgi:adenylate kinase family enzyme